MEKKDEFSWKSWISWFFFHQFLIIFFDLPSFFFLFILISILQLSLFSTRTSFFCPFFTPCKDNLYVCPSRREKILSLSIVFYEHCNVEFPRKEESTNYRELNQALFATIMPLNIIKPNNYDSYSVDLAYIGIYSWLKTIHWCLFL